MSRQATPTWRAGLNFHDPTRSGFARVSVLDQPDLFPGEGYAFADVDRRGPKPPTNSYRTSEDSPFTNKFQHSSAWREPVPDAISQAMSTMLKTEQVCNKVAANAIAAPTPGELRPLHSDIAQQAVNRERAVQLRMREQLRLQQMKDEDYWRGVEHDQDEQNKQVRANYLARLQDGKQQLTQEYQDQMEMHRRDTSEQRAQEARDLKVHEEALAREEAERQSKLLQKRSRLRREHEQFTALVDQRKEREADDRAAFEDLVIQQQAELGRTRDARDARARKRRDDKNAASQALQEKRAKQLEATRLANAAKEPANVSELAERTEAQRRQRAEVRKQAAIQRNRDYNAYRRRHDVRMTDVVEQPDFVTTEADRQRDEDARWKAINARKVRAVQETQADERRAKEANELGESRTRQGEEDTMYFLKDNEW
jgi:hypothetical protein